MNFLKRKISSAVARSSKDSIRWWCDQRLIITPPTEIHFQPSIRSAVYWKLTHDDQPTRNAKFETWSTHKANTTTCQLLLTQWAPTQLMGHTFRWSTDLNGLPARSLTWTRGHTVIASHGLTLTLLWLAGMNTVLYFY